MEVNAPKKAYVLLTDARTKNLFKSVAGSLEGFIKAFLCSSVMSYILCPELSTMNMIKVMYIRYDTIKTAVHLSNLNHHQRTDARNKVIQLRL